MPFEIARRCVAGPLTELTPSAETGPPSATNVSAVSTSASKASADTAAQPVVVDDGAMRSLLFSSEHVQSCMRLDQPDELVMAYTRTMMAFLLFVPAPRHVLMIGLGGGSLAKFCYRRLPDTRVSVVEISSDVIALRDCFAIPRNDERFEVIHDDGAEFLARSAVPCDVVLIDAFDESGVAHSLASPEFYQRVCRSLTAGGLLVMNLSGQESRYPVHIQNIRAAFGGAVLLVPVPADNNALLFAFRQPWVSDTPDAVDRRAVELEQQLGLEFPQFLECLRAGHRLDRTGDFRI